LTIIPPKYKNLIIIVIVYTIHYDPLTDFLDIIPTTHFARSKKTRIKEVKKRLIIQFEIGQKVYWQVKYEIVIVVWKL
jgi:hypothetical protein